MSETTEKKIPTMHVINGVERWFVDDELHREDGPAVSDTKNQKYEWFINGRRHRDDGPAVIDIPNGIQRWYVDGLMHRLDGPAAIGLDSVAYFEYGYLHRENGPAVITDKLESWYWMGFKHRTDGPAVKKLVDGEWVYQYFVDGVQYDPITYFINHGVIGAPNPS